MSWPVTLADHPDLVRSFAVKSESDPTVSTTEVFAPCCGRQTPADTVISTAGLVTVVRGGNHLPSHDHDWLCDGCRHILINDPANGWTWSKLFRALGAPAEVIRHHRAREIEQEERRAAASRGEGFNPGDAYNKAHASLPANVRELPGTGRPDA